MMISASDTVSRSARPLTPTELKALRAMNFDWTMLLRGVWQDPPHDVPALNAQLREEYSERLEALLLDSTKSSPLGWTVIGAAGSGKTHWLSICRREALARKCQFVLVDMTDVSDFWETVLQGYLNYLRVADATGRCQQNILLERFLDTLKIRRGTQWALQGLRGCKPAQLVKNIAIVVKHVGIVHRVEAVPHLDVIRALIAINSSHADIEAAGFSWLQGNPVDEACRSTLGFAKGQEKPLSIVRALSWLMSLCGPTVLAFDQLDPIIAVLSAQQQCQGDENSPELLKARAILASISAGLGALRDKTSYTFAIVSCLEASWIELTQTLQSNVDRFEAPRTLTAISSTDVAKEIIAPRVLAGHQTAEFAPWNRCGPSTTPTSRGCNMPRRARY